MKKNYLKLNTSLIVFLFLVYGFVPLCSFAGYLTGYDFVIKNSLTWAGVTLGIGGVVTVAMFSFTGKKVHKFGEFIAAVSVLLPEVNWVLYGFIDFKSMIVVALSFIFTVMIWIRFAKPIVLKVAIMVVAVLALPILSFFSYVSMVYVDSTVAVVESLDSPDSTFFAEVINETKADGAKHTYVNVSEKNADVDFGCCAFEKIPFCAYSSKGESFDDVDVEWKSAGIIVVNGHEYAIK